MGASRRSYKRRATSVLPARPTKRRRYYSRAMTRSPGVMGSINSLFPRIKYVYHTYNVDILNTRCQSPQNGVIQSPWGRHFRCNSVYDPDTGVTGSSNVSASLYPFMATYYKRYQVLWSKCKFIYIQSSFDDPNSIIQITSQIDDDLVTAPTTALAELRQLDKKGTQVSTTYKTVYDKRPTHTHRLFWSRRMVDYNQLNQNIGDSGNNPPGNQASYYFTPMMGLLYSPGSYGPYFHLQVRITYKVRWSDRNDIQDSTAIIPNQIDTTT